MGVDDREDATADTALAIGETATATANERPRRKPAGRSGLGPGSRISRYEIVESIGSGGMGAVYKAFDPDLKRSIAIKVLHTESEGSGPRAELQQRLLREAQAMARLSHRNLVTVFDVGSVGDQVFVAMELVDGETLRQWLAQERDWRASLRVLLEAGEGLKVAHEAGVIHRDFKPDNVLVSRAGTVQVADFGLSRSVGDGDPEAPHRAGSADADVRLTRTGAVMGTPAYMAPEQHEGRATDARTDQFSFAVSVYEAMYGQKPFSGDTMAQLSDSVTRGDLRPPPDNTDVPHDVFDALSRALSPDPDARWPSMEALIDELSLAAQPPAKESSAWVRYVPVAIAVATIALGVWVAVRDREPPALPPPASSSAPAADAAANDNVVEVDDVPYARTPVELPETMTTGPGAREVIRTVARANSADVAHCYEAELGANPYLSGSVVVHFEIGPNGHVIATRVQDTDFPELAIGSCVSAVAAMWKFPRPADGEAIEVTYPFEFQPSLADSLSKVADGRFTVPREMLDYALEHPENMARGARLVPTLREHERVGAKLFAIEPGSHFAKLGLAAGDTIETINGVRVTESVDEIVAAVRGRPEVVLEYTRRGERRTVTIVARD